MDLTTTVGVLAESAERLYTENYREDADGDAVDLAVLLADIERLDSASRDLRSALTAMRTRAHRAMEARGESRVVLPNGIVGERTGSWRRTNVDRDGLVRYVRKCADLEDLRIDPATGEMRSPDAVALELHHRCFRPEPKWSELKALGVDEEDFCTREFAASVRIVKAQVLS